MSKNAILGRWNVHYSRQRKNNGRLSRLRIAQPTQKDKGICFFGGNGNGIPISSGVSSRDAISHLPSTCSASSLSFSVLPRLPDQGCRRSSAVLTLECIPGVRFLGVYSVFHCSADLPTSRYLCKWIVPWLKKRGERIICGNNTSATLPIEKSHKSLIATCVSAALRFITLQISLRERTV